MNIFSGIRFVIHKEEGHAFAASTGEQRSYMQNVQRKTPEKRKWEERRDHGEGQDMKKREKKVNVEKYSTPKTPSFNLYILYIYYLPLNLQSMISI